MITDPFDLEDEFNDESFELLERRAVSYLEKEFYNCTFFKVSFIEVEFKRCRFVDCTFDHCDLSNLGLRDTVVRDTCFKDSKLIGVNWAGASQVLHLELERCRLDYALYGGLNLRKSIITDCIAREADFAETDLSEADLRGTDFANARFAGTNLMKADLRGATNYFIRPSENKIKNAKFSLPEATLLLYGLDIILEQ